MKVHANRVRRGSISASDRGLRRNVPRNCSSLPIIQVDPTDDTWLPEYTWTASWRLATKCTALWIDWAAA